MLDCVPVRPAIMDQTADKPSLGVAGHQANSAGIIGRFRTVTVAAMCGVTSPAAKHLFFGKAATMPGDASLAMPT